MSDSIERDWELQRRLSRLEARVDHLVELSERTSDAVAQLLEQRAEAVGMVRMGRLVIWAVSALVGAVAGYLGGGWK